MSGCSRRPWSLFFSSQSTNRCRSGLGRLYQSHLCDFFKLYLSSSRTLDVVLWASDLKVWVDYYKEPQVLIRLCLYKIHGWKVEEKVRIAAQYLFAGEYISCYNYSHCLYNLFLLIFKLYWKPSLKYPSTTSNSKHLKLNEKSTY